jgi:two-component system chemotaxis response regulator CheY
MVRPQVKVLSVYESVIIRQMIAFTLEEYGYQIIEAASGQQALSLLTPDIQLVLADYNLKDINGFDFLSALRQISKDVPLVLLADQIEKITPEIEPLVKRVFWLEKPFITEELINTVNEAAGYPIDTEADFVGEKYE